MSIGSWVSDHPLTSGLEPLLVLVSATCSLHLLPQIPHSAFFPFSKLCRLLSHVLCLTCLAKSWSSFKTQFEYFSSRKAGLPFVYLEHIKCIETDWPSYMTFFLLSPWAPERNSLSLYIYLWCLSYTRWLINIWSQVRQLKSQMSS